MCVICFVVLLVVGVCFFFVLFLFCGFGVVGFWLWFGFCLFVVDCDEIVFLCGCFGGVLLVLCLWWFLVVRWGICVSFACLSCFMCLFGRCRCGCVGDGFWSLLPSSWVLRVCFGFFWLFCGLGVCWLFTLYFVVFCFLMRCWGVVCFFVFWFFVFVRVFWCFFGCSFVFFWFFCLFVSFVCRFLCMGGLCGGVGVCFWLGCVFGCVFWVADVDAVR